MLDTAALATTGLTTGLATGAFGPHGWDRPGGWWVLVPIFWLVLVAAVVTAFLVLARRRGRLSGRHAGERRLAERFAAGEIDEDEYRTRLATLKTSSRT